MEEPIVLSFKLALIVTVILFLFGIPVAYFITESKRKTTVLLRTFISMPLVLPPTVLGFYLLLLFSPRSAFGLFFQEWFNMSLIFSFEGLVFASLVYSLPFMVNPLLSGFESLPKSLTEASYSLGKSRVKTLCYILIPNMKPAILTALVMTFAHTLGEFGVILMIGGSIPGKTQVASIAIYNEVEKLNFNLAHEYSAILLTISFVVVASVHFFNRNQAKII